MDATRARLSFDSGHYSGHFEWAASAMLIAATLLVASLVVRELRFAPRLQAGPREPDAATVVPPEAVSVPTLVLSAGSVIHVGEARTAAAASLTALTLVKRTEERGPLGAREVLSYQGFTLVFEPFERLGEPRIAAIFLQ